MQNLICYFHLFSSKTPISTLAEINIYNEKIKLSNGFSVEYSISTNAETARFDEIIEDIGDGRAEMI